jgi:phosphoribosylglycinamide formyltransferase-1
MINIGLLVSGGGTNLQAVIDACEYGILKGIAKVAVVISNKRGAFGVERAKMHGIPAVFIDPGIFADNAAFCAKMTQELKKRNVGLVCLGGFMRMIDPCLIKAFKGKVLNIHPALLPKFGGKGMYGHYVHEAVIKAGEKESGATVHWVDENYDNGPIVLQKRVSVLTDDTPSTLSKRVLEVEHEIYPEAIKTVIDRGDIRK